MNDEENQKIIEAHRQQLQHLELQKATFGIHVPAYIEIEIQRVQAELEQLQQQRIQLIFRANHLTLEPPALAQGLIVLVSPLRAREPLSALGTYQAIDYHRGMLRRYWLLATDDARSTAEALANHFSAYRLECTIHTIANGADAAETCATVTAIYTQIEQDGIFSTVDVIADITGGTKPMTAGLVLACGTIRPMQYMLFQEPGRPSLPVLLRVSWN
ncbi:MAG: hypothetical protein M3R61_20910 [Chloroflexota bacterium]|nr:hypothetical protein [Chloroflexota bacterium]